MLKPFKVVYEQIKAIDRLSFKGAVSLKAMYEIIPLMQYEYMHYDEATSKLYHIHNAIEEGGKYKIITVEYLGNPVVCIALSQARKVDNPIIKRYGMPNKIHI